MFGELLKKYRKQSGMTQEDLAYRVEMLTGRRCKVADISGYERGTNPKIDTIQAIAEVLGIPEQFLFDDSEKSVNKIVDSVLPNYNSFTEHTKKVPLLGGYVGAGSAGYIPSVGEKNIIDYLYVDKYSIEQKYKDRDIYGLIVIGDSMKPYVDNDDIVLFNKLDAGSYNLSDGKYIIETCNGIMVKNLTFKSNGDIVISSCNRVYSDEIIKSDESQEYLDIIGVVVGRILKN